MRAVNRAAVIQNMEYDSMLTAVERSVMLKEQSRGFVVAPKKDRRNWERTNI